MSDLKTTVVIIEKNAAELKELLLLLKKNSNFSILGTATAGTKGISLITNLAPQIAFINVDLQDINGLDFVRVLHHRNIFPEIVFTANNTHYAYESMELQPLDFMVKPIKKETIENMFTQLKYKQKKNELLRKMDVFTKSNSVAPKRMFSQKKGIVILELEEILYVKASLTDSILILTSGEEIVLKTSFSETFQTINHSDFVRVNRSYCINSNYLRKIDKRNLKCIMHYKGEIWEVPASKNTIAQLEKTNTFPIY